MQKQIGPQTSTNIHQALKLPLSRDLERQVTHSDEDEPTGSIHVTTKPKFLSDTFGNPEDMNTKSSTIPKDKSTASTIVVSPQTIDARAIIQQTALTVKS